MRPDLSWELLEEGSKELGGWYRVKFRVNKKDWEGVQEVGFLIRKVHGWQVKEI